ncbi:MAG: GDP-mannose 4,6-dehydratase [Acidimicrobiia bacterium]|nr:GDP-mannose 4,6-dehydratase [Acidimicrobiia bacterium]
MKALVTGVAGFVGSHLAERLLTDGWEVRGVDCLTDYYDSGQKRSNLSSIAGDLELRGEDLRTSDLDPLMSGVDVIFHQAGQPGVRASWDEFDSYVGHNVTASQRLLEAARRSGVGRFVYASSSSVYGNAETYPTTESMLPKPQSPYGVTKLAAEHLCGVYARNFDVHTVSLRYFTVFGPRQRPDMAMHRLAEAALTGAPFPLYGTGEQIRDFTFVGDVVEANVAAATGDAPAGTVVNVAGGGSTTLNDVIATIERLAGKRIALTRKGDQAGDVDRTGGDITEARALLGWAPKISIEEGLARQVEWHRTRHPSV